MTWSPLALAREDLVESLHAQATAGLAFIPVLAAQVLYLTISGGFLGSAIALLALLSARHYRLFVIVVALSMPVIFKAWPLPAASNPINALVTAHAVMTGLPLWAAPVACLFGIAVLGVLAFGMDRRSANRALSSTRVRIDRRWAWYWLIVGIGMLATAPLQDPELPLASQLLYGASTEGLSFVRWAFAVIVWGGLALVLMLRWSHTLTARLPYLLLRHGRATTLVARQSARDVVSGLSYVFLLLTMTAIFDAATGRPMLGWADALHLLIAGPLVAASIASAGVIVAVVTVAHDVFRETEDVTDLGSILGFFVIVFVGIFALMAIPNAVTHITGQISLASIAPQALRVAGKPLEKASDYSARRMNEVRSGFMHGKTEHHHLRDQARSDAERGQAARARLGQFIRDS